MTIKELRDLEKDLGTAPVLSGLLKLLSDDFDSRDMEFLVPRAIEEAEALGTTIDPRILDALDA